MRIVSIIHAAVVILAVTAAQAEAKGRRAFGGVWTAAHAPVSLRGSSGAAPVVAAAPASAEPAPTPLPVASETKAPEATPVIREAVAAAPWCANGRVVGSGRGFCEIN